MKRIMILVVLLPVAVCAAQEGGRGPAAGLKGDVGQLVLYPAAAEPKDKYQLLPKADRQKDADALPLYEKAIESLPKDFDLGQVREWLDAELKELPVDKVQATLQKLKPIPDLLEEAGKCSQCKWPAAKKTAPVTALGEYRKLAYVLSLQARLQMAQEKYEEAVGSIGTGLAMGRHMGSGPTLMHGTAGVAVAAFVTSYLEQLIQMPDAPNLYWALNELPKSFISLGRQMAAEITNVNTQYANPKIRKMMWDRLRPSHDRAKLLAKRLDRRLAALQCLEAMRLYAAGHDGKFPNELAEVTQVSVRLDPVSRKPFVYKRNGSKAVLEAYVSEEAETEQAAVYKLTLMEGTKEVQTHSDK
ncbi:MAG: hypothetical protein ACYTBJ_04030 [Planctomycetota bacterium]|jgi:hypothetical protein